MVIRYLTRTTLVPTHRTRAVDVAGEAMATDEGVSNLLRAASMLIHLGEVLSLLEEEVVNGCYATIPRDS